MLDVTPICDAVEEVDRKARKYAWQLRTSLPAFSTTLR